MEKYLKQFENFKLCYVDSSEYIAEPMTLYFTELEDVTKQWGDDWDDKPYEHNAGTPYEQNYNEQTDRKGNYKPIKIFKVHIDGTYGISTPRTGTTNSPYTVEDINKGIVPWLTLDKTYTNSDRATFIKAGTTFKEVFELLKINFPHMDIFFKYME